MKIKFPKKISEKKLIDFFKKKNLTYILKKTKKYRNNVDRRILSEPHAPVLTDLYRIYQYIMLPKTSFHLYQALP